MFDAQYELDELLNKHDWGHSSAPIGIDLALREGIRALALMHHDPWASEERLQQSILSARQYAKLNMKHYRDMWTTQPEGPRIAMIETGGWDTLMGGSSGFAGHTLWVSNLNDDANRAPAMPSGFPDWTIYQYSSKGTIPLLGGRTGTVDLNVLKTDITAIAARPLPQTP